MKISNVFLGKIILICVLFGMNYHGYGQVIFEQEIGLNKDGNNPNQSAMLDIASTNKGVLIPRMTDIQRDEIQNLVEGLLVYVTSDSSFYYYNGEIWQKIGGEGISDNLGNHIADQELQMSNHNILSADTIEANKFIGDGSMLSNITGDGLGDHTASQTLQMNEENIESADTVEANKFIGDGSMLTNIAGDDLGDHTASQVLQMNGENIESADTVEANKFIGDGSMLTNIPGDNLGDHQATQNIALTDSNWISADGGDEGIQIDNNGNVAIISKNAADVLSIESGDSPGLSIIQNGSKGFTAQSWDISGNETSFFILDRTNGSKLPFRIKPGSQNSRIYIIGDNVGISSSTNSQVVPTLKATLDVNGNIRMQQGAAAGYIPVGDADGIMTWTDPTTVLSGSMSRTSEGLTHEINSMRSEYLELQVIVQQLKKEMKVLQSELHASKSALIKQVPSPKGE